MKSCVIGSPTDICLDFQRPPVEMPLAQNRFATEPMLAVRPARTLQRTQEEAWHTSFEQAISARAARVSQQLRRLSTTRLEHTTFETDPLPVAPRSALMGGRRFWRERQRTIVFFCLGLGLFLSGFDLLGLLVMLR